MRRAFASRPLGASISLAADMGGFPEVGGLARYNPANGLFPTLQGLSAVILGPFSKPLAGDFVSVTNPGTGLFTLSDDVDRLVLTSDVTPNLRFAMLPIVAAPFTIDFAGMCSGAVSNSVNGAVQAGIGISDGTKFWTLTAGTFNTFHQRVRVTKWTTSTSTSSIPIDTGTILDTQFHFLRIVDDGTNIAAYISCNGKDYLSVFSEASNTFLTPTQWGAAAEATQLAATQIMKAHVYNLAITNTVFGDAP